MSTKAVGLRESSRNAVAVCPAKSLSTRQLKDNCGGRRLLRPPTHTQAKYHQTHRAVTNLKLGAPKLNPGAGIFVLVGVHRRSLPEEPTGRTTGNQTLLGGGGGVNYPYGEEAKDKKRKRANCGGQGTREITGGSVFYAPQPTPKPSTTNRIGR